MYSIDQLDRVRELTNIPAMDVGAPCPLVFADEAGLVLAYRVRDEPPYQPTTQPLAVVRFHGSYFHSFGPPNDEALDGHPLSGRGLHSYGVFEVNGSSLLRGLERMNSIHPNHDPRRFNALTHYIFTFHDSTFECVAESLEAMIEQVGLFEEYDKAFQHLKGK